MRHGSTGAVLCTLRNIQYPPSAVYSIQFCPKQPDVCYAASCDNSVYRILIPAMDSLNRDESGEKLFIKSDLALNMLNVQFYGAPATLPYATPFINRVLTYGLLLTERSPAMSVGITADGTNMAVGYGDASVKLYDMETQKGCVVKDKKGSLIVSFSPSVQPSVGHSRITPNFSSILIKFYWHMYELDLLASGSSESVVRIEELVTYKVHKLRLNYIPERLQRMHTEQVCALRCHSEKAHVFATAAWDETLRIWDARCEVGCTMTFGGVNVCGDSIDLHVSELIL
ncbi:hypothetical protein EVAR_29885_1 [Eumeta japonica]|uniref:Uncharacterized protein n=1 Tax=Eumeta variegata TaxID=151549 RepID=A0A4C1V7G7_EUMVA|nr:hypothetical protein EVAR_29885_1 [Eumeta japonica]